MNVVRSALVAAAALAVAACSGGDATPSTASSTVAPAPTGGASAAAPTSAAPEPHVEDEGAPPDLVVSVSVQVADGPEHELEGAVAESTDPFEQFASCSGFRATLGPYVVLVSAPDGAVTSVSVATADPVTEPGIHDASVRVEGGAAPEVASGTVTIDEGLRSGSFTAFTAGGDEVDGSFRCEGGDEPAAPESDDDGVLEVFALLRRSGSQRLVDMIAPLGDSVACADPDADSPTVDAAGDATVGAVTVFRLSPSDDLSMRVGTTDYEFTGVEVGGVGDARTFAAAAGDVTVDGAFRCG